MMMPPSITTDPSTDPLASGPPTPAMRSAKSGGLSMPSPAGGDVSGAAHLLGGSGAPLQVVMTNMMSIEKSIKALQQVRPDIAQLFAPIIGQARDMLAGSLADLAQGGSGMPPQDGSMPPPGGPPPAGPDPTAMGAPGLGGPPMPPPPGL